MSRLADLHCRPMRAGEPPLERAAIDARLRELAPEWSVEPGGPLRRAWSFPDFASALAFTVRVGALAEREDHHPELRLAWGRVEVELSTHVVGGLTDNDFILAAKLDALPPCAGTDSAAR
ncbi:MAG: 4a-hydroxytetrahydrobiopterin dehydratase [Planctomycetes bacterium]|nr:4a-hydroxytetrahydrobiopterin dehydratase [Planctomycetota bacterium]